MTDHLGRCWTLQYHPLARRGECVNIGLIAVDPTSGRPPEIRLVDDLAARLRRVDVTGLKRVAAGMQRDALVARVHESLANGASAIDAVERARSRQANEVRLAPPDLFRVTNFVADVERLVSERLGTTKPSKPSRNAEAALRRLLQQYDLDAYVTNAGPLQLRADDGDGDPLPFSAPLKYLNGCVNYLKPSTVDETDSERFTQAVIAWRWAACRIDMDLASRLVLVIDTVDAKIVERVTELVEPAGGKVRWLAEPEPLLAEIRSAYEAHRMD
jgi:hypothetical protein